MKTRYFLNTLMLAMLLLVSGGSQLSSAFAASDDGSVDFLDDAFYVDEVDDAAVGDPMEPFNRAMFEFNDAAFIWVFNPVATGYANVVPADIRGAVDNFFNNLQEPLRFVNTLLQGRFEDSGTVLARFFINSIGGVGGLGDPAGRGLDFLPVDATLGETLGTWGIGDGFYLVVPFFGPTTLRDFSGDVVERFAMSSYYYWADDWVIPGAVFLFNQENRLSLHLGEYEEMKQLSFDPYIALRNGYFQHRKQKRNHSNAVYDD
jgi:phospholipid-binding lipoprotein MlaA